MRLFFLIASLALAATAGAAHAQQPPDLQAKGKVLYGTYCARCHGADGTDTTTYPGAKSLQDITQRRTAREILDLSTGFAAVNLDGEQGAALVAYLQTFRSGGYADPRLLVETGWLAMRHAEPGVRVVDMRRADAYAAGHVPGAVRIEEGPLRNAADTETYLPSPESFAKLMGGLGISNSTHVVIYDDAGGRSAARLWYVLSAYGHDRVSLVNGGWGKWVEEGRPVSKEVPRLEPATFVAKRTPTLSCPSTEVLARKPGVVVLDTRSPEEYSGARTSPGSAKAGRIPGAVNVDWSENVAGPNRVFKPAAELKRMYAAKGVTPDKEIVTHCASGGRAAQSLFTLKLLGYPKVRVYFGSFADYTTRPDAPVEK